MAVILLEASIIVQTRAFKRGTFKPSIPQYHAQPCSAPRQTVIEYPILRPNVPQPYRASPCPTVTLRSRLGSAWLGWARQGSAGLGKAQLGKAWDGQPSAKQARQGLARLSGRFATLNRHASLPYDGGIGIRRGGFRRGQRGQN